MVLPPSYFLAWTPDRSAVIHSFYTKVADKSPLPVILHNFPSVTFIDLPAELCVELSDHPNIVAIKECSNNIAKIAYICEHVKQKSSDFSVLTGSTSFLIDALRIGAVGCISALANVLGNDVIKLLDSYNKSQTQDGLFSSKRSLEDAYTLQNKLTGPDRAISEVYGVAGLKKCMDGYGYYGGPCRLPLIELNQQETIDLQTTFEQNGFYWPNKN